MSRRVVHAAMDEAPLRASETRVQALMAVLLAWVVYGALEAWLWKEALWGAHFLAYLPKAWWAAVPLALAAIALALVRRGPEPRPAPPHPGWHKAAPWVAAALAAALFWTLRVRHLFWGDALPLSIEIPRGLSFHPDEPLSIYLHHLLHRLGGGRWSGATAVAFGSVLSGALFAGRAVQWCLRRFEDPVVGWLAASCLLAQGFTQIFYGYVENYAYLSVALLWFLTWGVDCIEGRIGPWRPLIAALVAAALHVMGWIALLPALWLVGTGMADRRRRVATAWALAAIAGAAMLAATLAAGLYGAESPAQRVVGAARKLLAPKSAAFRLPSARTLGDVWSQFVIVGPLSLPLLAAAFAVLRGRFAQARSGVFLTIAALAFSMPVFLVGGWGIGPARDWDIFAGPAVAAALCAVVLIAEATAGGARRALLAALLAASLFHTVPWIALNTSRERTMLRVAELPLGKGRSPMMLGTYFLNSGELPEAERWYRASLAADPTNVNSQSGLGLALARQGRYAEAVDPMRAAVLLSPGKRQFRADLIALLFTLERWSEAGRELQALLGLDPGDARAWLGLSATYARRDHPDSAAMVLEQAALRMPTDATVQDALASAYEAWVVDRARAGDWRAAREAMARLEARFPGSPKVLRLREGLAAAPGSR